MTSRGARTLLVLSVALMSVGAVVVAPAVPVAAASHRFLTLPFHAASAKKIQEGMYWTGCCHPAYHGGIDYIQGTLDRSSTWRSFPVYAAASGMACSQLASTQKGCISGIGNRVLIKTRVNGKVYYTYYGHFKSIVSRIPRGGARVHVDRGDLLGYSGHSGDPCCVIHLHFQLMTGDWKTIDPYGIYSTRSHYPDPAGRNGKHEGSPSYWLSDPPRTTVSDADAAPADVSLTSMTAWLIRATSGVDGPVQTDGDFGVTIQ
jgi:murein DD-endopeptidase MepM/ murein hydrolase activator NlpD